MKLGMDLPILSATWILVILAMVAIANQKERKFWMEVIGVYISLIFAIIGTFYPMHFYLISDDTPIRFMGGSPFHSLQFLGNDEKIKFLLWNIILFIPFGILIATLFKNKLVQILLYMLTIVCFSVLTQFSWDLGVAAMNLFSLVLGRSCVYVYEILKRRKCH